MDRLAATSQDAESMPSSPPRPDLPSSPMTTSSSTSKPKKLASVTPRRFNRFFNPSSSQSTETSTSSSAQRQLRDITFNATNRRGAAASQVLGEEDFLDIKPAKKRRTEYYLASDSEPPSSPPVPSADPSSSVTHSRNSSESAASAVMKPILPIRRAKRDVLVHSYPVHTANFISRPQDVHIHGPNKIPFCTAACNTNSLIAVGDETGTICILDTAEDAKPTFEKAWVKIQAHSNAIIDAHFSSDDKILATVSGDGNACVTDMFSRSARILCNGLSSSLKQVRFQPGHDSLVTTGGRDGLIAVFDLRSDNPWPIHRFCTPYCLPSTRSCRTTHGTRNFPSPLPLSTTPPPSHHASTRSYGTTALTATATRVYAISRDGAAYAYSLPHLRLGCIPNPPKGRRVPPLSDCTPGLPPVAALRHPGLRIGSFYIRAAVRDPSHGPPLLAVGSSEHAPILFPLDEHPRRHTSLLARQHGLREPPGTAYGPPPCRCTSSLEPDCICSAAGAVALAAAHKRETTGVAWAANGALVSVSDDGSARCWREDSEQARRLRSTGRYGWKAAREGWGWAQLSREWDEEEDG